MTNDLGWFMIRGEALADFLSRAYNGEDPDILLLEIYSNSEKQEQPE